ncbi:hypothetical protein [Qipengyuania atrilutea]|uniref:Uncharacterized protein n=1 Tax=Qipengyuania atrilutea TaxID=2744473 RepID=A0A850H358_9SPHN|nr:hypothetical protein [Actirhodobacter atriluteus]NVD43485.1 hypothetical protein [Actirhodobacter atriluteus]
MRYTLADLRSELAQLRTDTVAGLSVVAGNTGKTARVLEDVTAESGGDAISTRTAA